MKTVLVTGGAGFFGRIVRRHLLDRGYRCVSVDLLRDDEVLPNLENVQADIRDRDAMRQLFAAHKFDGVLHCAAVLAHGGADPRFLWTSNVDGTGVVCETMLEHGVRQLVFTSSNCLWGEGLGRPIREEDAPNPVEIYGRSKLEGERVIASFPELNSIVIRCPTIIDFGRLGLLSILFEFIHENRRVWTVGGGRNRYQFIYAQDLADACERALSHPRPEVFHVGSDDVKSLGEVYSYVIRQAGSRSRVASLPRTPAIAAMQMAHALKVSPLGPYHYKMIAEDFLFDTTRIRERLGWRPTLTNEEMLWRAYQYYARNRADIEARSDVSAHRQPAKMGVIRLLKWVS